MKKQKPEKCIPLDFWQMNDDESGLESNMDKTLRWAEKEPKDYDRIILGGLDATLACLLYQQKKIRFKYPKAKPGQRFLIGYEV